MKYCIHLSDMVLLFKDDFICQECGKQFMTYDEWINEHYDRHGKKDKDIDCDVCNIISFFNNI